LSKRQSSWMVVGLLVVVAVVVLLTTRSCNTTEGIGEDIEELGDKVQDATD
jgi:predicted small secreted protein